MERKSVTIWNSWIVERFGMVGKVERFGMVGRFEIVGEVERFGMVLEG